MKRLLTVPLQYGRAIKLAHFGGSQLFSSRGMPHSVSASSAEAPRQ